MAGIGERLAQARRDAGKSLADAERATKIRTKYLHALEEDDFATLPDDAYARGFLQNYADYLGLDPGELLRQYRTERPAPAVKGLPEPIENLERTEPHVPRHTWIWVGVIVAAALVIWIVIGLVGALFGPRTAVPDKTASLPAKTGAVGPGASPAAGKGLTVVMVSPTQGSRPYIELTVDGRVRFSGNLAGPHRFIGARVRLRTMSPDQVVVVADGKRVTIPAGIALPYEHLFRGR